MKILLLTSTDFQGAGSRNPVGFIDQFAQLGGRVVTGEAAVIPSVRSIRLQVVSVDLTVEN